jgi:HEAT repeat protein
MGLLDKMFGGGTGVEVALDATQVPVGGVLSGRAIVRGGNKDLQLTDLKVRLLYVSVQSKEDSPMPDIDTRILIDNTIASNQPLPAGSAQEYSFQLPIPAGTEASAHNVSYKVMVVADIPKVKDPSATADLQVVEASAGGEAMASLDQIYSRWPALRGAEEGPMRDALWDFRNACYSEREQLIIAEPILAGLIRQSTGDVRQAALEAWANLLDGQVRREHLVILQELVGSDLDARMTREVIEAAAKFADEGALGMVQGYAQHPAPDVRKQLADALRFAAADKFPGKRELLLSMAGDPDAGVRAAVYGAFSDYREDPQIIQLCAQQIENDPSPDVQAAIIGTICFGHHHGMGELTLQIYERHLQNPHEMVRKQITEEVHWLPTEQIQRIGGIVQALLNDGSEEVRRSMAWQFRNLDDMPQLAPLLRHAIENDPSPRVRKDGLGALTSVVPAAEAVAYYQMRMQNEPTEDVFWAALDGVRFRKEPECKAMVQQLAGCQFAKVASAARDALEYE